MNGSTLQIVIGLGILTLLLSGLSIFVWRLRRSSNLFDRQYRFAVAAKADLRLGAPRCGGRIGTVLFRAPNDSGSLRNQTPSGKPPQ